MPGGAMAESVPDPGDGHVDRPWERRAIEAEADEGLLLAEYALRMRLKNRIIVDTMTASTAVDAEAWADEARLMLGRLRLEQEASARRMDRERDLAELTEGRARHEHDYRTHDAGNLARRRRVYRLVGRRLLAWEHDHGRVAALLEAARADAAEEMDAAIRAALAGDAAAPVEDERLLRERLRLVTAVDLPALERAVRGEPALVALPPRGRLARLLEPIRRWLRL